jgi:hypothetical protein
MKTRLGNHGAAGVSVAAALFGAVMFFGVLYVLYSGISDAAARSSAVREAANVAAVLDSVGSSPAYCKAEYRTPDKLSGKAYMLHISGDHVIISLSSPAYNGRAIFFSRLTKNFSGAGGSNLTIIKDNNKLEVT